MFQDRIVKVLRRLTFLCFLMASCMSVGQDQVSSRELVFGTDGRVATMLEFGTAGEDVRPAVILLHGGSGYTRFKALYDKHASALVNSDYRVFAVMYYSDNDRQIMTGSDPESRRMVYQERLGAWVATVSDALDVVESDPRTDTSRIAVLGFSQGAYVAVGVAGTDHRVSALVEKYGGLPNALVGSIQELPPTLIVHGEADDIVSVTEAYALAEYLEAMDSKYEIVTYADAGHGFDGNDGSKDAEDSVRRVVEFLRKSFKTNAD